MWNISSIVIANASGHIAQLMSWTEMDWHLLWNLIEFIVIGAPAFGCYLSNCFCFTSQPIFINSTGHFNWPSVTIIQKFNDIFFVRTTREVLAWKTCLWNVHIENESNWTLIWTEFHIQNSYSLLMHNFTCVCCHMIIVDGGVDLNVLNWKTGW